MGFSYGRNGVGCFPVFLVMVKKQFSKVLVVNARAPAVSHKL